MSRVWWHTPLIPALRRQRQADFWVRGQPGLQSEFQDSQGYTEKPCLKKEFPVGVWFPSAARVSSLVSDPFTKGPPLCVFPVDSGVGAGIDSYYEYLLKAYVLLGDDSFLERFNTVSWFIFLLICS
jgi:hypothetical protein